MIEPLLRDLTPQVLGAVLRKYRDFAAAEDAVQEALIAAAAQWPRQGVPENPKAWLIHVASRRMADSIRADIARRRREEESVAEAGPFAMGVAAGYEQEEDDSLVLLFMCCHPALTTSSAIALTLRAVGGLTTAEIASAFLVPEATMGQRISRAKQSIRASGVPFRLPAPGERAARLRAVLHVLYLIFNEGYVASSGALLQRVELTAEAIRLTRALHRMLPEDPEAAGLLALMLLTDSRRKARTGPEEQLIPLDEQDRSLWDRTQIEEGISLLTAAFSMAAVGPYQLQAAISAVHAEAPRADATDWPQILALYEMLKRMSENPMVTLNHAIAAAMVNGPPAGLALLDALGGDPRLAGNHRLFAARAHLLEMSGDKAAAIDWYRRAAEKAASLPEREYLIRRAARLVK